MNKLFHLKQWLTLPEAERRLSTVFEEPVTEADILRLALDGHLKLSVYFVNGTTVRRGEVVRYNEAALKSAYASGNFPDDLAWAPLPWDVWMAELYPDWPHDEKAETVMSLLSRRMDDERYLNLDNEISYIDGVWDLPMIGAERQQLEHLYHRATDGPDVEPQDVNSTFFEGVFVERGNEVCQLAQDFEHNENRHGSLASGEWLKTYIAENNVEADKAQRLLEEHNKARQFLLEWDAQNPDEFSRYEPAIYFPEDAVIVVRTDALRELEQTINGTKSETDKPVTTTERNSLLTIIAALCDYSAIRPQERGAAKQIARLTEEIGAAVSDDTVRRALEKIPDALESRMK